MSAAQKAAVIQHALNMGDLFAQNAALRHGLPDKPPRPTVPIESDAPPPPLRLIIEGQPLATATANATVPEPQAQPAPIAAPAAAETSGVTTRPPEPAASGSLLKTLAPWLIAGATAIGGPAAGWWLSQPGESSAGSTTIIREGDPSLLQHLQEQGFHLPAEKSQ